MTKEGHRVEDGFEYSPSQEQKEKLELLHSLVKTLQEKGVRFAVAGGYGLDALLGSLTRNHKDYDFVVYDESENDFREIAGTLGFQLSDTKESGVVIFSHNEIDVELEYMPSSKIQELLQDAGVKDINLESEDIITNAELQGITVPTFNLDTYKMFDSLQNERFETPDPHATHKQKIYAAIKKETS